MYSELYAIFLYKRFVQISERNFYIWIAGSYTVTVCDTVPMLVAKLHSHKVKCAEKLASV